MASYWREYLTRRSRNSIRMDHPRIQRIIFRCLTASWRSVRPRARLGTPAPGSTQAPRAKPLQRVAFRRRKLCRMFAELDWEDSSSPAVSSEADLAIAALLEQVELQGPPVAAKRSAAVDQPSPAPAPTVEQGGVELGFVTPYPSPPALPEHFPSKVGGSPVWLQPTRMPPDEMLRCSACGQKLRFLMQLYCPRWPELPHAFHRSVMLFCCTGACVHAGHGLLALRCNLPQETPFYQLREDGGYTYCGDGAELGECGGANARAAATSGQQVAPLRGDPHARSAAEAEGANDHAAPAALESSPPTAASELPELLVTVEMEGDWAWWLSEAERGDGERLAHAERLLSEYEEGRRADAPEHGTATGGGDGCASGAPNAASTIGAADGSTSAAAGGESDAALVLDDDVDEGFSGFQRRVGVWPTQVLRYCFTGSSAPLWLATGGRPASIPPCGRCGAPRWFEFQVLPQLLSSLELPDELGSDDALDWGTIAVFSCSRSCGAPPGASCAYAAEYCWHQGV